MTEKQDVFQWANHADALKNEMRVDLYLFTKNFTAYSVKHAKAVDHYVRALFLYDMISEIQTGAATGLTIRDIHKQTEDDHVIDFVALEDVANAQALIEQIAYGSEQIENFNPAEHEMKRIAGVVACCSPVGQPQFYIVKQMQQSGILEARTSFELTATGVKQMAADAALQIKADNQVLVVDDQIFVFNEAKFAKLFKYEAKKVAQLQNKLAAINKQFKLSFPEGVDLEALTKHSSQLAEKILRSDPAAVTQDQVIEQADKFQLALMTDDQGAIIIMDTRDAVMFANLLNDDYVDSDMTGHQYLAVKKKEVDMTEAQQVNMGV